MAIQQSPLEQRLGQILPGAATSTPAEEVPLEPMPGAETQPRLAASS